MNAVRHGLLAKCVVLKRESRAGFDSMLKDFVARFEPSDGVELALVEEMLSAFWRQRRAWAIETRILDTAMSREPAGDDERTRLVNAFTAASSQPTLELVHRYETRLHRIFQRALSNLVLMRSLDEPREPPLAEPPVSESKPEERGEDPAPVEASTEKERPAITGTSVDGRSTEPDRSANSGQDGETNPKVQCNQQIPACNIPDLHNLPNKPNPICEHSFGALPDSNS